jgi:hypothetical protein
VADPSPKLVDLARRILEQEAGESSAAAASAAAVETVCQRLKDHLVDLLGSGGISALLRRALHLSHRDSPLLAGVSASGEPDVCFIGLAESLAASTDAEAAAAAAAVVAHVLDLLVTLLGEELGMKPIRKLWPQATSTREIDK